MRIWRVISLMIPGILLLGCTEKNESPVISIDQIKVELLDVSQPRHIQLGIHNRSLRNVSLVAPTLWPNSGFTIEVRNETTSEVLRLLPREIASSVGMAGPQIIRLNPDASQTFRLDLTDRSWIVPEHLLVWGDSRLSIRVNLQLPKHESDEIPRDAFFGQLRSDWTVIAEPTEWLRALGHRDGRNPVKRS